MKWVVEEGIQSKEIFQGKRLYGNMIPKYRSNTHLLLVSFVGELDADVVVFPDLRDDGSLAADDLGMKLGIYRHGYLETAQGLKRRPGTRDGNISFHMTYLMRIIICCLNKNKVSSGENTSVFTLSSCSACSSFTLSSRPSLARSTLATRPVTLITSSCFSGCGTQMFTCETSQSIKQSINHYHQFSSFNKLKV